MLDEPSLSPRQTLDLEGELADNEMLTYLQMISHDDLRPAPKPLVVLEVQEVDRSSLLIRRTTVDIGRPHQWPSQGWDDRQWQTYLRRPHLRHWVAFVDGTPAGLLSLDVPAGCEVEVDTLGLLPDHIGQGLGSHSLTVGVRLAWAVAPAVSPVWLHTSSRDHHHALSNYEGRGFRRYQIPKSPKRQP
jgi:GNAT superfamily N-acetyltransferase